MKRSSKRVAAGVLALSMVPGMMPGSFGDVLTWGSANLAKAISSEAVKNESWKDKAVTQDTAALTWFDNVGISLAPDNVVPYYAEIVKGEDNASDPVVADNTLNVKLYAINIRDEGKESYESGRPSGSTWIGLKFAVPQSNSLGLQFNAGTDDNPDWMDVSSLYGNTDKTQGYLWSGISTSNVIDAINNTEGIITKTFKFKNSVQEEVLVPSNPTGAPPTEAPDFNGSGSGSASSNQSNGENSDPQNGLSHNQSGESGLDDNNEDDIKTLTVRIDVNDLLLCGIATNDVPNNESVVLKTKDGKFVEAETGTIKLSTQDEVEKNDIVSITYTQANGRSNMIGDVPGTGDLVVKAGTKVTVVSEHRTNFYKKIVESVGTAAAQYAPIETTYDFDEEAHTYTYTFNMPGCDIKYDFPTTEVSVNRAIKGSPNKIEYKISTDAEDPFKFIKNPAPVVENSNGDSNASEPVEISESTLASSIDVYDIYIGEEVTFTSKTRLQFAGEKLNTNLIVGKKDSEGNWSYTFKVPEEGNITVSEFEIKDLSIELNGDFDNMVYGDTIDELSYSLKNGGTDYTEVADAEVELELYKVKMTPVPEPTGTYVPSSSRPTGDYYNRNNDTWYNIVKDENGPVDATLVETGDDKLLDVSKVNEAYAVYAKNVNIGNEDYKYTTSLNKALKIFQVDKLNLKEDTDKYAIVLDPDVTANVFAWNDDIKAFEAAYDGRMKRFEFRIAVGKNKDILVDEDIDYILTGDLRKIQPNKEDDTTTTEVDETTWYTAKVVGRATDSNIETGDPATREIKWRIVDFAGQAGNLETSSDLANATLNVAKNVAKARFISTPKEIADAKAKGYTIKSAGIVYDKTTEYENDEAAKAALVVGSNNNGVVVKSAKSPEDAYALNITPDNDKTIWARGYVTVVKGGSEYTIYSEVKSTKVSNLVRDHIKNSVTVSISDATLNGGMARFVSGLEAGNNVDEDGNYDFDFKVVRSGIVYKESGTVVTGTDLELGKENISTVETLLPDAPCDYNIAPNENKVIYARGFAEVEYAGHKLVFYSNDVKSADISALEDATLNSVKMNMEAPVFYNGKARFVTLLPNNAGLTIKASGVIYNKNTEYQSTSAAKEALVLANDGKNNVVVKSAKTPGSAYALNVTPVEDKTVWARSYATVTDGAGNTFTIYSDVVGKKVSELFVEKATAEVSVALDEPTLKDGKKIRFVADPLIPEGYEVNESGIIYDKNTVYANKDEAKSKLTDPEYYNDAYSNVKKKNAAVVGKAYALNVTPVSTQNPVYAIGFVTVSMNGHSTTIYSDCSNHWYVRSGALTDGTT